jgi:hypothetical protein
VDDVLSAYQSLAQSKMNMLDKQTQSAIASSQPKKKDATGGSSDLVNQLIQKHASTTGATAKQ